ncbi:MAG: bifunctional oligoribonuclease/PAP phosphatase NrnA [Clostridia bacterium]|nr:bifunctional oligoribonuclease/PAP phosphatase NrnA [Clostridia bacterium]
MVSEMKITDFSREIAGFKSALIFSHVRPDGDTIGSAMALKEGLKSLGIRAETICAAEIPEKYSDFKLAGEFLRDANKGEFEAHIAVDCSTEQMFSNLSPLFFSTKNTFNLDHHISNTKYARRNCVIGNASCCENVFIVLKELGVTITPGIANSLLLGVVTDTGCFAHKNVTPATLSAASELVSYGADLNAINYSMFKAQPIERARLFSIVTSGMKTYHGGKLAVIAVRAADFAATGAAQDMTEGFIDFPLSVNGVEVAVSIMETGEKTFKISYRSKGKVNVNDVAKTFGGGGHVLASGCMLNGYFEDVLDKIVFTVGNYL